MIISQLRYFNQINACLVNIREFFQKQSQITYFNCLNGSVCKMPHGDFRCEISEWQYKWTTELINWIKPVDGQIKMSLKSLWPSILWQQNRRKYVVHFWYTIPLLCSPVQVGPILLDFSPLPPITPASSIPSHPPSLPPSLPPRGVLLASCGSEEQCWSSQSPAAQLWLEGWRQEWPCPLSPLNCCCCWWGKGHWGPSGWRAWPCDPAAVWVSCSVPHTAGITAPRLGLSHGRPHCPSTLAHGASERGHASTSVWWNLGRKKERFLWKALLFSCHFLSAVNYTGNFLTW